MDGRVLAEKAVSIETGKAAFLDVGIIDPNIRNAGVRAVVIVDPNVRTNIAPPVAPSVEVFNTETGKTALLDPGSIYSFNPQPDPAGFGMIGIADNQTARINVAYVGFHSPPSEHAAPSDFPAVGVTMQFVNGNGRVMAESRQNIEFGKAVSFDLPAGASTGGARQRLRAVVLIDPNIRNITPCIMPSVEILNNETGRTVVFYPGNLIDGASVAPPHEQANYGSRRIAGGCYKLVVTSRKFRFALTQISVSAQVHNLILIGLE